MLQGNTAGQHSAGVVFHDSGKSRVCTCEANGPPIFATGKLRAHKRRVNHRGEARDLQHLPAANADWPRLVRSALSPKNSVLHCFFNGETLPGSNPEPCTKKYTHCNRSGCISWRRLRDLNPRDGYPPYALSRGASSANLSKSPDEV